MKDKISLSEPSCYRSFSAFMTKDEDDDDEEFIPNFINEDDINNPVSDYLVKENNRYVLYVKLNTAKWESLYIVIEV